MDFQGVIREIVGWVKPKLSEQQKKHVVQNKELAEKARLIWDQIDYGKFGFVSSVLDKGATDNLRKIDSKFGDILAGTRHYFRVKQLHGIEVIGLARLRTINSVRLENQLPKPDDVNVGDLVVFNLRLDEQGKVIKLATWATFDKFVSRLAEGQGPLDFFEDEHRGQMDAPKPVAPKRSGHAKQLVH